MIYNIHDIINDIHITVGETKRMNCPTCGGYNTFTITNNMGSLVWNCYKASCNIKGTTRKRMSVDEIKSVHDFKKDNEFVLPEYVVQSNDNYILKWFYDRNIDSNTVEFFHDVKENRVVFPIHQKGKTVDAIGRSLGKRLPKWRKYGSSGLPFTFGCGSVAVVVEDCLSALCIGSEVYVGVAVLGTTLTDIHKRYLSQFSTTIIALDPDALPKTMQFAKELRGHVNTVKVLRLTDDLKYRKEEDLINLNLLTPKGEPTWN
tara:strand:- start:1157 stop:1936 length:780 start_codon:yes stop_codon:yes gene_type:complete